MKKHSLTHLHINKQQQNVLLNKMGIKRIFGTLHLKLGEVRKEEANWRSR